MVSTISLVLPNRKIGLNNRCHIIVRGARQSAQAKQDKIDAQAAMEVGRKAHGMTSTGAVTIAPVAEATSTSHVKSHKRIVTKYTCVHVNIHAYYIAQHIVPLLTMMSCAWQCKMPDGTVGRTTRSKRGGRGGKRRSTRK